MTHLTNELLEYLRLCGLSERKILACNQDTCLYHDLGDYGDVAEANMELLQDHFGVDLSGFRFEDYFPVEIPGNNFFERLIFWSIPFAGFLHRRRQTFMPITLRMIHDALLQKKWHNVDM